MTRGLSPAAVHKTYRAEKRRKKFFNKSSSFSKRSLYPQPFSAAVLSSHSQQQFFAAILSSSSQQPLSAALLSSHSQPSSCCGQGLVVSYYHHVAVVRGWWSAIIIMLLWSGVGGQLLSSCYCGQGLVVSYLIIMLLWSGVGGQLFDHHLTVVRGWWSAI